MLRVNLCYLLPVQVTRWPHVGSPGDSRPTWLASPGSSGTSSPTSCSSLRTRPSLLPALFYAVHYTAGPLLRSASHCRPSHSTQCSTLPALLLYAVLHSAGPPTLRSASHCGPSSTQYSTLPAPLYAAVIHTAGPPPLRSSDFPFSNSVSFPHDPGHYFACCESVLYHGFWLHVLPCFITFCSLTVSSAFSSDLSSHSP